MKRLSQPPILPFVIWVEFAVLLIFPGRMHTALSGIPINGPLECALFVVLLINFILYALRRYDVEFDLNTHVMDWRQGALPKFFQWITRHHLKVFVIAFLIKILLFASNFAYPPNLFNFSYYSHEEKSNKPCLNVDNIFRVNGATHLGDRLAWDNQGRYERWYQNDLNYRGGVDLVVSGFIQSPPEGRVKLIYSGEVKGTLGTTVINSSSTQVTERIFVLKDSEPILPVRMQGSVPPDFHMEVQTRVDGKWKVAKPADPRESPWAQNALAAAVAALALILALWGLAFAGQWIAHMPFSATLVIPLLMIPVFKNFHETSFSYVLALCYIGALIEQYKAKPINYLNWILIMFLCTLVYFHYYFPFGEVGLRPPTDDPITYDTLGRAVIKFISLEGGEPLFYATPGFRYYMAVVLCLFGEYNIFPKFLNASMFLTVFWLFFLWLGRRIEATRSSIIFSLAALWLLGKQKVTLYTNLLANLSEFLAWILLAVGLMAVFSPLTFKSSERPRYDSRKLPRFAPYTFAFCMGMATMVRPNQLFGLFCLFVIWMILRIRDKAERRWLFGDIIGSFVLYLLLILFPLWHNLHYGNKFVLFTTSASNQSTVYTLPPGELRQIFSSPEVRGKLAYQLNHLLALRGHTESDIGSVPTMLFHLILIVFLISSIRLYRGGAKMTVGLAMLVVFGFAGPHVFFTVDNHYPRHILVSYIMMAVFGVLFLGKHPAGRTDEAPL